MNVMKILVVPASCRTGSLNRRLAGFAASKARAAGFEAKELDLRALNLPIYDGDLELAQGIPTGAHQLQQAIADCDCLLVVTPEYNGFPTPLFVNAFDWLSRIAATPAQASGLAVTANKPAALLSASPGPGGGLRSMNYMRQYLQMAFAMIVVPQQFALGKAHQAFNESGTLLDAGAEQSVETVLRSLTALAQALQSARQA
jgi:chromate reductase